MEFWANVQRVLAERNLSGRWLAAQVGISPAALSTYSRGSIPSLDVAWRISKVLGMSLDSLVSSEPKPAHPECPSPEDHDRLRILLDELGLGEIAALTQLVEMSYVVEVAEVLARNYPRPVSLQSLQAALPRLEPRTLETCLLSLRRRGQVAEVIEGGIRAFALLNPIVEIVERQVGAPTNALRAVRMILGQILPELERRSPTAHLTTFTARIDRKLAEQVSQELYTVIMEHARGCLGPGEGDTDIFLEFGVALQQQDG